MEKIIRGSGQTTRIIDQCIQDLFIKGECYIYDHYQTNNLSALERMVKFNMNKLKTRLVNEHGFSPKGDALVKGKHIAIKQNGQTLTLQPNLSNYIAGIPNYTIEE